MIGKNLSFEELEKISFDFGLEVEEDSNNDKNVRVEIPANRYDLLSVEGLSMALSSYLDLKEMPRFNALKGEETIVVDVDKVNKVRPYIVAGILRNLTFT